MKISCGDREINGNASAEKDKGEQDWDHIRQGLSIAAQSAKYPPNLSLPREAAVAPGSSGGKPRIAEDET